MIGKLFQGLQALFGSFGLTIVILAFMFIVTLLGTVVQETQLSLYDTLRVYFESWVINQEIGETGIKVPLPGMLLLMVLLAVNLLVGGIIRMKWRKSRIGILITHFGIAFLMLSGLVKFLASHEGLLAVYESDRGAEYHDPHRYELAIFEPLGDGKVREYVVPDEQFEDLRAGQRISIRHADLPFSLELYHYMSNCWLTPSGTIGAGAVPMIEGHFLRPEPPAVGSNERNLPGCYVTARPLAARGGDGPGVQTNILFAADSPPEFVSDPWTVDAGGKKWGVKLRNKVRRLPFDIHVDDFQVEFHPGTETPKSFLSDVVVVDSEREMPVRIQMNEPLRRDGFTLYQTNWGPQKEMGRAPRHYTVFAVSKNPSDQWPKWSCYVIGFGLLWHFASMLMRYIAKERRSLQESV